MANPTLARPAMTPQQAKFTSREGTGLQLYKELAVGKCGYLFLAWYELVMLLVSNLPGLLGLVGRMVLYPTIIGRSGRKSAFGRGVLIRNPKAINLGAKVIIDDYAALDVRGEKGAIEIEDHAVLGRFSTLVAKDGSIRLGSGVNIGSHCRIGTQSKVDIGESTLIAAFCYIGPGNHQHGTDGRPLIEQPMDIKGGVSIGKHVWIGTGCTIVDGVTVGDGAIVGAHSLVRDDVPPNTIVAGTPAKIIRQVETDIASGKNP